MKMSFKTTVAALLLVPTVGLAEPTSGQMIGEERDLLWFQCKALNNGNKKCNFTQVTGLKPEADKNDLKESLAKIDTLMDEIVKDLMDDPAACKSLKTLIPIFENIADGNLDIAEELASDVPDFDFEMVTKQNALMDPRAVMDNINLLETLRSVACDGVTRERVEKLIRLEHEQKSRTCRPLINNWEGEFRKVSDSVWAIVTNGPYGECGVVRLDRFVCDDKYESLCNFVSEKRVMNPDGEGFLGLTCSDLDENKYTYARTNNKTYLDCDIIDF